MRDFTDTQLVLLSAAAQRPDRLLPFGERVKGAAAYRSGQPLVQRGFAMMVDAGLKDPLWVQEENGKRYALKITVRGLQALGIELDEGEVEERECGEFTPAQDDVDLRTGRVPSSMSLHGDPASGSAAIVRVGSKKALVIGLLQREEGASVEEIVDATGWLAHTTRAMLTGLRKGGHGIEKVLKAGRATRYRIDGEPGQCDGESEGGPRGEG